VHALQVDVKFKVSSLSVEVGNTSSLVLDYPKVTVVATAASRFTVGASRFLLLIHYRERPEAQPTAPSAQPGAPAAQLSRPQIETRKVEGTDNVYIFRNGNHQAMFVVAPEGVIAADRIAYGRPTGGQQYWLWGPKGAAYRNRLPFGIVQIFEKHGFIWGGKWGHFDTMHFEYGPELL